MFGDNSQVPSLFLGSTVKEMNVQDCGISKAATDKLMLPSKIDQLKTSQYDIIIGLAWTFLAAFLSPYAASLYCKMNSFKIIHDHPVWDYFVVKTT